MMTRSTPHSRKASPTRSPMSKLKGNIYTLKYTTGGGGSIHCVNVDFDIIKIHPETTGITIIDPLN